MTFDPIRAPRREENSLELGNREASHITGQLRVQREMKSLSDLIFDEVRTGNFSERQSRQRAAGFSPHVVIAGAADVQIALFKLVGEDEYLTKLCQLYLANLFGDFFGRPHLAAQMRPSCAARRLYFGRVLYPRSS